MSPKNITIATPTIKPQKRRKNSCIKIYIKKSIDENLETLTQEVQGK